jgi:hypothetical protein
VAKSVLRSLCGLFANPALKHRPCTYNVILRRVRATVTAVGITQPECICGLNGHAPYSPLWPAQLHNIFPHYLMHVTTFEEKLLNTKCVFRFSLQLLSEKFLILRGNERDMIKKMYVGLHVPSVDCNNTNILNIFPKNLKVSNIMKIRPVSAELFQPDGETRRS